MSETKNIVEEKFCFEEETHLTVHKTSIFVPGGDGFLVYGPAGEIIFRVDSFGPESDSDDEIVLMDSTGVALVTLIRKKLSLHQRWEGFLGEKKEQQEPFFSIFKTSIIGQFEVVAELHRHPKEEYHIEGSFGHRSCSIYRSHNIKELVAEIKRKVDPDTNMMLGKDVFMLCLKPGIDSAIVMSLVLVLDHMSGLDVDDNDSILPLAG